MPAVFGDGADEGLTVDALWALQATGASAAEVQHVWSSLSTPAAVDDFTGPGYYRDAGMPDARFAGQSAKLLLAAATVGADAGSVGGRDLRRQTLDLVTASGPEAGRLSDTGTGSDSTNVISQSLGVMGLAATGPLPVSTVRYLLSQQCAEGFFRMYDNDGASCDAAAAADVAPDNDGTAMGVQALMAAAAGTIDGSGVTSAQLQSGIDRGVAYLAGAQAADGSFVGGVGTSGANSNSTGLAAATLSAGGDAPAAAKAAAWVATLQATVPATAGTPLAADAGAIAYDPSSLTAAMSDGIGQGGDQWRRATAQAVLALSPHTYPSLVGVGPGAGSPPTTPTGSGSGTTPPSPTGSTPRATANHHPTGSAGGTSSRPAPTASATATTGPAGATAQAPGGYLPAVATAGPTSAASASTAATSSTPASTTSSGTSLAPAVASATAGGGSPEAAGAIGTSAGRPAASTGTGRSALLWAVLAGLLLGGLATVRPWRHRPRGRHS